MSSTNTPTKQRKGGDNWWKIVENIRSSLACGKIHKLFEDDYFIFELIKLLYQDAVESAIKIEILAVIEQHGSGVLPTNSVDQSISALLDVFRDISARNGATAVTTQLLITVTTIFIENEELLETNLCSMFTSQLVELLNKVNHISSRRIRATACHCLVQLESTRPGLLWKWREVFVKLVKSERTDVGQDYMLLLITVASFEDQLESVQEAKDFTEQSTPEGRQVLPVVSHIMDNVFLLSPAGLATISQHIVNILKRCSSISPTVFKPLVLQCLSCLDPCIISLVFYLENEFPGEIISESEKRVFLKRTLDFLKNPKIKTDTRLFIAQWIMGYLNQYIVMFQSAQSDTSNALKDCLLPQTFDPLDVHTCKLDLSVQCCTQRGPDWDISSELHYLTQLAETTGGVRITCALYHILYLYVTQNSLETVDNFVLSITRKLFQKFPHLIPVIVDFLQAVKSSKSHSKLHAEILSLLHETVLSLPLKSLLTNYNNYLQVWLLSAQDPSMLQQPPLRRLLELVQEASLMVQATWSLGYMVLSVCRAMVLHHHTDILYTQMGDLLWHMMKYYPDQDVRDQARDLYALLTLTSDSKEKEIIGASVVDVMNLGENIADFFHGSTVQTVPAEIHELDVSPITWHRESIEIVFSTNCEVMTVSQLQNGPDAVKEYQEKLSHLETKLRCVYSAKVAEDSDYQKLVAVAFHAEDIKELSFGGDACLVFLDKTESRLVEYSVIPKVPSISTVNVKAVFGHQKCTYECDMEPLKFQLEDFLTPFPWHIFSITDKQAFFDMLWTYCTKTNAGTHSGVESIKILEITQETLTDLWSNALLVKCDTDEDAGKTDDYLFFLPPCYHLMFHVRTHSSNLVVHIASDYWPVLAHLDLFLDNLGKSDL